MRDVLRAPGALSPLPRLVRRAAAHGRARPAARPAHPADHGLLRQGRPGGGRLRHRPGDLEPRPGARRGPPRTDAHPAGRRAARGDGDRRARGAPRRRPARRDPRRRRLAGACQPPVGACMRALWPVLLDTPDGRHAAYSMEGALLEVVYICGPVLIVAGIGSWSTSAAMLACAAFLLVGDLAFAAHPISRAWRPHAEVERDLTGALRGPGVRVLVAVFVLCGLSVGAVEVVVPAVLDTTGHRELTGILLGLWGVGSMFAGLAIGRLGAATNAPRRLAIAARGVGPRPRRRRRVRRAARARADPARGGRDDRADVRLGQRNARRPGPDRARSPRPSRGPRPGSRSASPRGSTLAGALVEASSPAIASAVARGGRRARVAGRPRDGRRASPRPGAGAGVSTGRGAARSYTRPPPAADAPWLSHLRRWRNW